MAELILLRRKVSIALDTVEETETGLFDIELLGVLQSFELLGVVEVGLNLIRMELHGSCPHASLDIATSVVRLFAVSCARHDGLQARVLSVYGGVGVMKLSTKLMIRRWSMRVVAVVTTIAALNVLQRGPSFTKMWAPKFRKVWIWHFDQDREPKLSCGVDKRSAFEHVSKYLPRPTSMKRKESQESHLLPRKI